MSNVRTVSETKRDFYKHHTRPINSIYRRVVEELMVEMHLLLVNVDFHYDPIYALGVVTSFNRFMQGYRPEKDQESIFAAVCQAVGGDPQQYQQDAERLKEMARGLSASQLISWFSSPTPLHGAQDLYTIVTAIASNPKFKYSRLFAIGLYSMLEQSDPELVKNQKQVAEALQQISQALHLDQDKLQKDLELYRSNLEKMAQVQTVIEDAIKADRKKREQRAQDKDKSATPPSEDKSNYSQDLANF